MTSLTTLPLLLAAAAGGDDPCVSAAQLQRQAGLLQTTADAFTNAAICVNLTDPKEADECWLEARFDFVDTLQLVHEQYEARLELCGLLGGGAYDPEIEADDFSTVIDNPYLPFPVGAEWTYESETEDGLETIVVTVLEETREILGVECVSVRDVVFLEGHPVEDTIDWYAQDEDGNVWYFGEISFNFEDDYVADIEGSWLAGIDGAKPGIVMLGNPEVGTTYRQEWLVNEAEDAGTVLAVGATVDIEFGRFTDCVQTHDFLPPEPDASENKFFAPGIGFIYETKADSDETVELVGYSGL